MNVSYGLEQFDASAAGTILSIGNFDGVHRGHQRILASGRRIASRLGAPLAAMTFEPHPIAVLAPERVPQRLITLEEKLALLKAAGAEACIVLRSEPALLSLTAEEFLRRVVECCRPRAFVEGADFNFGRGRGGSVETLREFAPRLGFALEVIDTVLCEELPGTPPIRSSSIRAALREGRVEAAAALLGRPYRLVGVVGSGDHRGRELGFPTANLQDIPHLLPHFGVYAAAAQLESGELHLAAVNIGPQPTFAQQAARTEAFVLDWDAPLHDQRVGLHLLLRLRGQQRFAGPDALVAQLHEDVAATRAQQPALDLLRGQPLLPL